jgi:cell division protein YceG involved in septum cleavage
MKKKAKKKRIKKSKIIIYIITILVLITAALFLFEQGYFKQNSEYKVELKDECGVLFNTIIHQIKTVNNCESLCKIECDSQQLKFERVEFSTEVGSCNECSCYCK